MRQRIAALLMVIGLLLSSCKQATVQASPTILPTGLLTPYRTTTPIPITPTVTIRVTIPVTPTPTSTPFLHTIKNDDTMLGIAIQYGIKLKDLQAANPDVNPHFMTVGNQLIIPISGVIPDVLPTTTAMPIQTTFPRCYGAGDGGAWCIVALQNELETALENLSVWIGLYNLNGDIIASQLVDAPLNILKPDTTMPIMAYFAPPLPDEYTAQSEVVSALAVQADDVRYVDLQVEILTVDISEDGRQAVIQGEVVNPAELSTLSQVWVLAVAYDANGEIVGARKWKSAGETQFEISVYSLAGMIDHVEVLTEVRPLDGDQ